MKFSEIVAAYAVLMTLPEAQRKILANLIQEAYDHGLKGPACDGCNTRGVDLEETDLEFMGGAGKYCQFCREANKNRRSIL